MILWQIYKLKHVLTFCSVSCVQGFYCPTHLIIWFWMWFCCCSSSVWRLSGSFTVRTQTEILGRTENSSRLTDQLLNCKSQYSWGTIVIVQRMQQLLSVNMAAAVMWHIKKNLWWHHWWLVMVCGCSGWKGNLCERSLASCVSLFILIPCVALAVYYLLLQTFVLRLEFLLSAVLLCFYSLEFLLGLLSVSAFSRWPDYLMRVGGSQFVKNLYLL